MQANSQGTMNNVLFGNEDFGYYETICGGAGATAEAPAVPEAQLARELRGARDAVGARSAVVPPW